MRAKNGEADKKEKDFHVCNLYDVSYWITWTLNKLNLLHAWFIAFSPSPFMLLSTKLKTDNLSYAIWQFWKTWVRAVNLTFHLKVSFVTSLGWAEYVCISVLFLFRFHAVGGGFVGLRDREPSVHGPRQLHPWNRDSSQEQVKQVLTPTRFFPLSFLYKTIDLPSRIDS